MSVNNWLANQYPNIIMSNNLIGAGTPIAYPAPYGVIPSGLFCDGGNIWCGNDTYNNTAPLYKYNIAQQVWTNIPIPAFANPYIRKFTFDGTFLYFVDVATNSQAHFMAVNINNNQAFFIGNVFGAGKSNERSCCRFP